MNLNQYKAHPSKASSLPYWKSLQVVVPEHINIVRDDLYDKNKYYGYTDKPFFKLVHHLSFVSKPTLVEPFHLINPETTLFKKHIEECYEEKMNVNELDSYPSRSTYDESLWILVADQSDRVVASAIGEIDKEIGEGIIEWVEVSPQYRKQGLGTYLVNELLSRMSSKVSFVTVSGQLNNKTNPLSLYLKCGFEDEIVWHILTKVK